MDDNYKVYKLTSPSNKVYIGITKQRIKKRWLNGKGYKKCPAIFNAINKYGWESFKKEILYEGLNEEEAKVLEKQLIKQYNSFNKKYGYNLTEGGDGTCGRKFTEEQKEKLRLKHLGKTISAEQREKLRKANLGKHHSEETKRKMSNSRKGNHYNLGRKLSEETKKKIGDRERGKNNPKSRQVICLETLKVYDTITQAKEETGATKIGDCCRHDPKHKTSGNFHWEYYNNNLSNDDYKDILEQRIKDEVDNSHRKMSEENKKILIEISSVKVVCIETGEVFDSIKKAAEKYKISSSCICCCCKGKSKTAKRLHWKYASVV